MRATASRLHEIVADKSCKIHLLDKLLHGYCAEFARAPSVEETHADKSPESEVVSEDDVDSSAGRGGGDSGRPLRPSAFAMGGLDSGAYSFAHNLSYHSSHGQDREASPSERLIVGVTSPLHQLPKENARAR
jgi:hypothetical protein